MNTWLFLIFFEVIALTILCLVQYYFYRKVIRYASAAHKSLVYKRVATIVFAGFLVPLILLIIWQPELGGAPDWIILFIIYPLYIWHFSFVMLFFILMLGKALQLPFRMVVWLVGFLRRKAPAVRNSSQEFDSHRRVFLRQGITILAGATLTGSAVGAFRKNEYEVNQISIPINQLPEQLNGFSIALISDIHSSVFMTKDVMQRYVKAVNELHPDLTAVVGDFVNSQVDEVYPFAEAFSELKAPYGIYGVLGNHDYYTRDVDTVAKNVEECGIKLLVNQRLSIEKETGKFYLLGVDDIGSGVKAGQLFDRLLKDTNDGIPKILLCHRPYFFEQAADRNISLTLSGHTHGGQIVFAKLGTNVISFARIASPYVAGLYNIGSAHMYVSRGIGTVGVPVRLNCPPEITKIVLMKA